MATVEERLARIEDRLLWLEHDLRQVRKAVGIKKPGARAVESTRKHMEPKQPVIAPRDPRPTPLATPAVPPKAAARAEVPAPVPRKRPEPAPARDWERFFGMAVLGRVGVAAVLLAAAYFAKLAYVEMSETLRVASIYGLAAAFVAAGFLLRGRVAQTYIALLWGGGTAAAYLAGVTARLRYELVDAFPALLMLLAASALGQFLARRVKLEAFASVALAGAFAAPLLVANPTEDRTALMIYLLVLHGWSAWIERVWDWKSTRFVGIAGTVVVGGIWLVGHGAVDASTYAHVQLYVLGLVAPELVRLARGFTLQRETQLVAVWFVASAQAWLLIEASRHATAQAQMPLAVCGLAAVVLLALAYAYTPMAGRARNRHLTRGFARVGWIALAFAAFWFVRTLPADGAIRLEVLSALVLGAMAVGALMLRKRLGVGETGALAASALATVIAVGESRASEAFAILPAVLVGPAALLWTARQSWIRCGATWAGLVSVLYLLAEGHEWHTDWVAGAAAGGALWLSGVFAASRARSDHMLARNAVVGMGLVVLMWMVKASWYGRPHWEYPHLFNGVTAAGIVIAAAGGFAASRLRTHSKRGWTTLPQLLWIAMGAVLLMTGARATGLATKGLMNIAANAYMVLYLSAAGVVCAAVGRWRVQPIVVRTGLGIVLAAGLYALSRHVRGITSAWFLLVLLAPVAGMAGSAWLARKTDRWVAWGASLGLGLMAFAWGVFVARERLPVEDAVFNLRFLAGLAILGAGYLVHRSHAVDGVRRDVGRALVLGAAVFGFVVGLMEVWELVRDLPLAWPDVLVSVYATLFAAGMLVLGFFRKDTRLRYSALALFGGVVVKVGLHDLATADRPLRILVTGVLGLVLLAAAFAYARRKEDKDADDGAQTREPLAPTPR